MAALACFLLISSFMERDGENIAVYMTLSVILNAVNL